MIGNSRSKEFHPITAQESAPFTTEKIIQEAIANISANGTRKCRMETYGRMSGGKIFKSDAVLATCIVKSIPSLIQAGFLPNHGQY